MALTPDTPIPVGDEGGAAHEFLETRGAVLTNVKDGPDTLPYSWFIVWQYINSVQLKEATEATNVKLNELIRLQSK